MLDATWVLKETWNVDGKYAREACILRCWRKADILPIVWEVDIDKLVRFRKDSPSLSIRKDFFPFNKEGSIRKNDQKVLRLKNINNTRSVRDDKLSNFYQ